MKKIYTFIFLIFTIMIGRAQEINHQTVLVLKGGITVMKFASQVTNFQLGDSTYYHVSLDKDSCIRIWTKTGVSQPKPTNMIVNKGKLKHVLSIEYKTTGDFNATYYDFSNALPNINIPVEKSNTINQHNDHIVNESNINIEDSQLANNQSTKEKAVQEARIKQLTIEAQQQELALANERKSIEAKAESDRILMDQQKRQADIERKKAIEKQAQQVSAKVVNTSDKKIITSNTDATQQAQNELNTKLNIEKKQLQSLDKKLAEERAKKDSINRASAIETRKNLQRELALAKAQQLKEIKDQQKLAQSIKQQEANQIIVNEKAKLAEQERIAQEERKNFIPPPANIDPTKKFPLINFKEPPIGQFYDAEHFADTTAFYKASQFYLTQPEDALLKEAVMEMDQIRMQLCNINFSGKAAYIRIKIENKSNNYFLLGATLLKILETESGKVYQLNPYYISSFPIIEANTSKYVMYVMKPEQAVSSNSLVMLSIRERQSNMKLELNFPGNLYTDALKAVEK